MTPVIFECIFDFNRGISIIKMFIIDFYVLAHISFDINAYAEVKLM
jgi:hypothetical protein